MVENIISYVITLLLVGIMIYSAILDFRKREIPIELFLLLFVPASITGIILNSGPTCGEACFSVCFVGGCYLIIARYFGGGGGDVIMMASLSLWLGYQIGVVIFVANILLILYRLLEKMCEKEAAEIAYAPFVLAGVIIERILYFL